MEFRKKISVRIMLWICIWFVFLGGALSAYRFYEWEVTRERLLLDRDRTGMFSLSEMESVILSNQMIFWNVLAGSLGLSGFLLWMTLRRSIIKAAEPVKAAQERQAERTTPDEEKKSAQADREKQFVQDDRRRTLQLLSILQREGRLMDFLKEDLTPFDDQQIGVAVRSIQENCKKALETYLDPKAVMDQEEGSEVVVPDGFDPNAIKLTGDVSGTPPFKGTLQHRGWRIGRFDLPTLSGAMNPDIISPAEVEI